MKINGKHKNGIQKDSNGIALDETSKKAVAVVEKTPLKSFDAQSTWEKLSKKLGQVDKRFVTWGIAMAASFSLLVAANISLFNWNELDQPPQQTQISSPITSENATVELPKRTKPITIVEQIEPHTIKPASQIKENRIHSKLDTRPKTILLQNQVEKPKIDLYPLSNPFVTVFAKANFQTGSITPEFGLDFKLAENYTARRRDIFKLGISSQLNFKTNEEGDKKMHPHTFVNLEFTSLNKKTNKGWTTRAGYLLNPDGHLYQDTTIKVSIFRNIGKHIKVGPEVIFTENLKQAYPSISLVLG